MADGISAQGLTGAQLITRELAVFAGSNIDAWLEAPSSRKPNRGEKSAPSFLELIDYLAGEDGRGNRDIFGERKERDIRPRDQEAQKAAEIFTDELIKQLRRAGETVDVGTKAAPQQVTLTAQKQARRGMDKGMKDALKFIQQFMVDNVKGMKTNTGAPADKVSDRYAGRRNTLYGVSESVVYVASGQLAEALMNAKPIVKTNMANIQRLIANVSDLV
jgi:hypothetical protein